MMNEKKDFVALTDDELAGLAGGYVTINSAGCYELYDEEGNYQWTFRGDQLRQLRSYARQLGISDRIITEEELERLKARGRFKS